MKTIAWVTDLHLNEASVEERHAFFEALRREQAAALLIAGDIGDGALSRQYLLEMRQAFQGSVYFVLGNHDYYGGSIGGTRALGHFMCRREEFLYYLTGREIVPLSDTVGLVGHDGWADARCGDFMGSDVVVNDYTQILDFHGLDREVLMKTLQALGTEAARRLAVAVWEALLRFEEIVVLTHVPPFREVCHYHGEVADDAWAPHFVCQAVGDTLIDIMQTFSSQKMRVLCGHAHSGADVQVLPNLRAIAGTSIIGKPSLQQSFSI